MEELRPGIGRETERRKGPVEVEAEEGRKGELKVPELCQVFLPVQDNATKSGILSRLELHLSAE